MGHVSDFNGVNNCDETDVNQTSSDLISADNFLDSLNENFAPIYNSFPDDVYRHPNLYASSNPTSFSSTDDGRNGYFDEPLELDFLFDPDNFNFDFGASEPILDNGPPALQNDSVNDFNVETSTSERNGNTIHVKQDTEPHVPELQKCVRQEAFASDVNAQENYCYVDNFETTASSNDPISYTAETIFKSSEPSDVKNDEIPKIIIRLKPESKCTEQDFATAEASPLTIADNVKLGRRRNGNLKCDDSGQTIIKHVNKHKTHKKKSRHKKRRSVVEAASEIPKINQNFSTKLSNCNTASFASKNLFLNQNSTVNIDNLKTDNQYASEHQNGSNCQVINNTIICFKKSSPSVDTNLYSHKTDRLNKSSNNHVKSETVIRSESDQSVGLDDSFQFDFENTNSSLLSSEDIKKEIDEDFLDDVIDPGNIPDLNKSLLEEIESIKTEPSNESLLTSVVQNGEFNTVQAENSANSIPDKSDTISDLIEELNAHNQQVFEEIEISTSIPELELSDEKNIISKCLKASHESNSGANDINVTVQNKTAEDCSENMNTQIHLSNNRNSLSSQTLSVFHSLNNHNDTARPRNISSSGSSATSKSSTSHRSYRKRRRSSSSSSSSSDREKFYNRPVKYDPVTQTYCDEFGREIRPNELKYYLDSKSRPRDSHSNNGSSSSSRSKSPRYKSYHRKHHKSRSSSRSHRRRRYSSSRSRSRSHDRKYKIDSDKKYRSPSPNYRVKRHYLDVEENMRAYEERRVMYVGDIPPDYTVEQLKDRFGRFGSIQAASIKSKITADGSLYIFGFVTFKNRSDVCQAIERGNENPSWPRFDLNFGGRRRFCNGNYTDLDGKVAEAESGWYGHQNVYRQQPARQEDDFAELLHQEQRRLGMSKK